ncbi:MAG: ArnT family glycosyltransferase [Myxococcota bacterium]
MSVFRAALLVGAVVCLPFLGSVGLWDPWETHYAEVGRQMLARGDLVHPYWQNAWFFSKPPLVPWISALGLFLSGAQPWAAPGVGPLPAHVEWAIRLPIALLLIFAIALLADAVAAHATRRAGLLTAVVLWTMPLMAFIARQTMTDGPFVACLLIALACVLKERWLGFFASVGVALLAKGLLGFLPFLLVPTWWLLTEGRAAAWARVRALPPWGVPLTLAIGAPWYVAMARFEGRDDEGRRFVERFFGHDHLERLVSGVHTTTPGGGFTYFLEQGGYALAPWAVLLLVTLTVRRTRLAALMALTSLVTFALFTASATRFHHYVLPVLPGVGVLLALELDELLEHGFTERWLPGAGLVVGALVWKDLWQRPRHLLDLFTYNHERPYPEDVLTAPFDLRRALLVGGLLVLGTLAFALWRRHARLFVGTLVGFALVSTLTLSWQHWPALGRHWTQRELVQRYFSARTAEAPLIAFLMNWKGETFYSRNAVTQISARDPRGELHAALSRSPGPWFVVVEHARFGFLQGTLPPGLRATPLEPETTNKFVLVRVDRP